MFKVERITAQDAVSTSIEKVETGSSAVSLTGFGASLA